MALPIPPTTAPLGGAPSFRLIQGGLGRAAVAAPAAAGAAVAAGATPLWAGGLALAGSFALGFEIGKGLLGLWSWANQVSRSTPIPFDAWKPETWPTPKPGQTLWRHYYAAQQAPGWPAPVGFDEWWMADGEPSITQIIPDGFGPGLDAYGWRRGPQFTPTCCNYRVMFVMAADFYTTDGSAPNFPVAVTGSAVDRTPLLDLLAPITRALGGLGLIAPPAPRPAEPERRAPIAPPTPGQPIPLPPRGPGANPGIPGARPGGAPAPGPGQPAPGRVPIGEPLPQPQPQPQPGQTPDKAPRPVPLPGGVPRPTPGPVPVTPAEIVRYPNVSVGDQAARPRADLDSLARELGKQEQKLAGLLGGLGYPEAFDRLVDLLTSINPGGSYTIRPACGTKPGGEPLDVIEVPIQPTIGDTNAVIARLDAIAELLDLSKQLRQPICKGKPIGEPVTVTAVSVE